MNEDPLGRNWRFYWDAPWAYRIWSITLRAQGPEGQLISHNMQVKLGAPELERRRADDIVLVLESGWWVTLRHEFANAPKTATAIVASASAELSEATALLTNARGDEASDLARALQARTFAAVGPAGWTGRDPEELSGPAG